MKSQLAELKHSRGLVAETWCNGKWAVIRNIRAVICDSPPSSCESRKSPKVAWCFRQQLVKDGPHSDSLLINCWNGKDSLWSLLGLLHDVVCSVDILVITETHDSLVCPLSGFVGYQWVLLVEMRWGPLVVFKAQVVWDVWSEIIYLVLPLWSTDAHTRFLWICISPISQN